MDHPLLSILAVSHSNTTFQGGQGKTDSMATPALAKGILGLRPKTWWLGGATKTDKVGGAHCRLGRGHQGLPSLPLGGEARSHLSSLSQGS